MKLIKINEQHYIVVDDSKIKEGVNQYYFDRYIRKIRTSGGAQYGETQLIVTHSTQPLEHGTEPFANGVQYVKVFNKIKPLSLSEVEEAINGYITQKLSYEKYNDGSISTNTRNDWRECWKEGFNAHKELVKDKLFTVDDMKNALKVVYNDWVEDEGHKESTEDEYYNRIIQSLPPKTEWEVEFDEGGKLKLI